MIIDEDGIPIGWELVSIPEEQRNEFFEAADEFRETGDSAALARVEEIVEEAYHRLFGLRAN